MAAAAATILRTTENEAVCVSEKGQTNAHTHTHSSTKEKKSVNFPYELPVECQCCGSIYRDDGEFDSLIVQKESVRMEYYGVRVCMRACECASLSSSIDFAQPQYINHN